VALNITHLFQSAVADDPVAAAAGEVLPQSHWNAIHRVLGNVDPSQIAPIAPFTVLANDTNSTAAPTAVPISQVGGGGRDLMTANRTYYIRSGGNDSNDGKSAGTAWLTVNHAAVFLSGTVDGGGFKITLDIGAGSFAGSQFRPIPNLRNLTITGAGSASTTINDDGHGNGALDIFVPGTHISHLTATSNQSIPILFEIGADGSSLDGDIIMKVGASAQAGALYIYAKGVLLQGALTVTMGGFSPTSEIGVDAIGSVDDYANWTVNGTPDNAIFISAFNKGLWVVHNGSYGGGSITAVTNPVGSRAFCLTGGVIESIGGASALGQNYFPGTQPPFADSISSYDGYQYANTQGVAPPTTSNLPQGAWAIWKDQNNNERFLAFNDLGTIYVIQLGKNINAQTAAYTLTLVDQDGIINMNSSSGLALTIPPNASLNWPVGTGFTVIQGGTGALTFTLGSGVTMVPSSAFTAGQWNSAKLVKLATNQWLLRNGAL
jgi:hypothetical protein